MANTVSVFITEIIFPKKNSWRELSTSSCLLFLLPTFLDSSPVRPLLLSFHWIYSYQAVTSIDKSKGHVSGFIFFDLWAAFDICVYHFFLFETQSAFPLYGTALSGSSIYLTGLLHRLPHWFLLPFLLVNATFPRGHFSCFSLSLFILGTWL